MQAISWSLFSATIVAVALLLKQLVAGVAACVRCWALSVGLLMVATQAMLALSLLTYKVGAGRGHAQRSCAMQHHTAKCHNGHCGIKLAVQLALLQLRHANCTV